jgi:hypothetical protein
MELRLVRVCTLAAVLAVALSCAGVAWTGPDLRRAAAPLQLGIASEEPKWDADGGRGYYSTLTDLGLTTSRLAITWDPSQPLTILERTLFDSRLPQAAARGIHTSLVITASHPLVFSDPTNRTLLTGFLQLLARTYPQITTYVIGNEPNDSHFWRPQFSPDGRPGSAAAFVDLLARSYDALKAVNPAIRVSAGGLVARGNDNPYARSHSSISPVRFIAAMGQAYRASGRSAPIMDEVSFHPYPQRAQDELLKSYAWPNAGIADLDRIKQAYWDAFTGSGQPTFETGLSFNLDETGWQVSIAPEQSGAYEGLEVSSVTDERSQAEIYGRMIRYLACDPSVKSALIYRLTDDSDLAQWQSGLIRANGSRRASYESVKQAIAQTGGRCAGQMRSFRHATDVVGARPRFQLGAQSSGFGFTITAEENALFEASIMQDGTTVVTTSGKLTARWNTLIGFPHRRLKPGWYVYSVRLKAELNSARTSTFVSPDFRVG